MQGLVFEVQGLIITIKGVQLTCTAAAASDSLPAAHLEAPAGALPPHELPGARHVHQGAHRVPGRCTRLELTV